MTNGIGEQELLRRIAQLPREVSPGRDPWADIAARIGQAGHSRRPAHWRLLAVAASVTLALAVGWLLAPEFAAPPAVPAGQAEFSGNEHGMEPLSGLRASVRASEAEYQAAFREFIPVGSARTSLSPQTVALIETSWDDLRRTESELAAALAIRPNDPFLNDRMLELRARQLGFLQRLAALDLNDRRLTI